MYAVVSQRADYTVKFNQNLGRHGWLRLTPAYSVKLVGELIDNVPSGSFIFDPFSGTATTGLVAAEHGFSAHLTDINPFLIWFGNAKCSHYSRLSLTQLNHGVDRALASCKDYLQRDNWVPKIYNIQRWWSSSTLRILAALRQTLVEELGEPEENKVSSLGWIAFCRLVIETSSAAFNHVSMSFRDRVVTFEMEEIISLYRGILDVILESAAIDIPGKAQVFYGDSRNPVSCENAVYTHVITSPPYANRISYIRELRPYMYWMGFLDLAKEAGELDWQAIGGTWGVATSRLSGWESELEDLPELLPVTTKAILNSENKHARLMGQYVSKYFHDMHLHFANLRKILADGAKLSYIVGNSSFYGIPVHTQRLMEESLRQLGYSNVNSEIIRKRNSKKELFEFLVSATWE